MDYSTSDSGILRLEDFMGDWDTLLQEGDVVTAVDGVLCKKSIQAFDDSNRLPFGYEFTYKLTKL